MRAKISDRQARIRRLMDGGFGQRDRLARAEARAILEESERATAETYQAPIGQGYYIPDSVAPLGALAESLAAFVVE